MINKVELTALIIAAGEGQRQRVNGNTKPLVPLLGLTLIERVIHTAKNTGIHRFHIVIGYNGDKIKNCLGDGHKYGVTIDYILNDEWKRGNGVSVLKAKPHLDEPFILLMADHIFDEDILRSLQETDLGEGECILCVDSNNHKYLNIDDATKLVIENHKIIDIGKQLERYNGIDTGIFLCGPAIFDALEESISRGDERLSGGVKILADRGKMNTFDMPNNYWIDVDDPGDLKNAESLLCEQLKKKTDGPVSKFLNRPISKKITKLFLKTGITPNQISVLNFLIAVLGALFFSFGEYINLVIGGILVQLSSIIDGCDGEVAYLKFMTTKYGGWFDAVLDRYADALIILGMVYGEWIIHSNNTIWFIGFAALLGSFMSSYTAHKYDSFLRKVTTQKKYVFRFGRDIRLFLIFVGALTNQVFLTLIILALVSNFVPFRRIIVLRNELD